MNAISVKVANFPGEVKEISVSAGSTIRQCFEIAGITPVGTNITRNAIAATMEDVVSDNDRIISAAGAKGN